MQSEGQCSEVPISAPGVHPIAWECVGTRFTVKNLDSPGMKYTNWNSRFLTLLLATLAGIAPLRAQSAYIAGLPTLNASNATAVANSDDPQSSMITLHARV